MTDWNDEVDRHPGHETRREWRAKRRRRWLTPDGVALVAVAATTALFAVTCFAIGGQP